MVAQRITLPSGRTVLDTGRVLIGLRAEPRPQDQGSHAELFQRLICTPLPKRWEPAQRVVPLTWYGRLVQRIKGML